MNGATFTVLASYAHPGDGTVFLADPPPLGVLLHFDVVECWGTANSMPVMVGGAGPHAVTLAPWCGIGTGAVPRLLPPGTPVWW